jgi:hypothetical protein
MTTPAAFPDGFKRKFYMPSLNRILLSVAAAFGLVNGLINPTLLVFIPLWLAIVVIVWCMPIAVVTDHDIRPALFRPRLVWRDVAQVTARQRRTSNLVQLTLTDGRTVSTAVPGTETELLQYFVYWAHTPPSPAAG